MEKERKYRYRIGRQGARGGKGEVSTRFREEERSRSRGRGKRRPGGMRWEEARQLVVVEGEATGRGGGAEEASGG